MFKARNGRIEYGFERLEVWKIGKELVKEIYLITKDFPVSEKFGLISQLQRAAISIPGNIAEGSGKRTKKDFASFIRIAIGSLLEVITYLEIALDQKYISGTTYERLRNMTQELYFKLIALDKSLLQTTRTS